jgi:hypothetical protein
MTFLRYFLYVLGAAILASVVGGVFASIVALISPEFVKGLFSPLMAHRCRDTRQQLARFGECFIGAGVMGFCLALVTLVQIAKVFTRKKGDDDRHAS